MRKMLAVVSTLAAGLLLNPMQARAHCDAMDGPVVVAAQKALETGKLNPVLAWVRASDEPEIKAAFNKTLAVRKLNPQARDLADRYFFETLVRVHRASEGAPYTGLKPAGQDPGPAVRAADKAIEKGSIAEVEKMLTHGLHVRLNEMFQAVNSKKAPGENVAAGREWVAAYVPFVHYVEGVHGMVASGVGHDGHAAAEVKAPAATCGHAEKSAAPSANPHAGHAGHEGHAGHDAHKAHKK